ncbi:MAG: 3'(2'),5'-bisphosphate nucleotidase CysQ [Pontiellaceae bacterium]
MLIINLLNLAVNAASNAGDAVLDIYNSEFDIKYKKDNSPLTHADIEANRIICNILSSSNYPILSEENILIDYNTRKKWKRYWLIDPIDGTKGFINKSGEFTINIALMDNNIPILGVILNPITNTYYFGFNEGSYKAVKNKHFIHNQDLNLYIEQKSFEKFDKLSVSKTLKRNLKVVSSKSHLNDETILLINKIEEVFGKIEKISSGSSIKLCLIAEGLADLYPRLGPTSEWDIAAADAIIRNAGGNIYKYDPKLSLIDYVKSNKRTQNIQYNKKNILNPYFIVSGLHEYNM